MIPVQFPEANMVLAMEQDEYEPLSVYRWPDGRVACCFRLTDAELQEITRTRTVWLQQLTFGGRFAPIALSVLRPEGM
jgi:hypothetical protein